MLVLVTGGTGFIGRSPAPFLDRRYTYSNAKARSLRWAPRSVRETVIDCAESLLVNSSV